MYDYHRSIRHSPVSTSNVPVQGQNPGVVVSNQYNSYPARPPPSYNTEQQLSSRQIIINDYITSQQMHGRGRVTNATETPVKTEPSNLYYASTPPPQTHTQPRQGVIQRHNTQKPIHYPPPPGLEAFSSLVDVAVQQPSLPVPHPHHPATSSSGHEGLGKTMADRLMADRYVDNRAFREQEIRLQEHRIAMEHRMAVAHQQQKDRERDLVHLREKEEQRIKEMREKDYMMEHRIAVQHQREKEMQQEHRQKDAGIMQHDHRLVQQREKEFQHSDHRIVQQQREKEIQQQMAVAAQREKEHQEHRLAVQQQREKEIQQQQQEHRLAVQHQREKEMQQQAEHRIAVQQQRERELAHLHQQQQQQQQHQHQLHHIQHQQRIEAERRHIAQIYREQHPHLEREQSRVMTTGFSQSSRHQQQPQQQQQQQQQPPPRQNQQAGNQQSGDSSSTLTAASLIDAIITHQINQSTDNTPGTPSSNNQQRPGDRLFQV